jgi:type I restriction enzyme S subunit
LSVPPEIEQHRIVAEVDRRLSLLRETEAQVDANLQRAERMRQSVLASAFGGKLVKPAVDVTDNPKAAEARMV